VSIGGAEAVERVLGAVTHAGATAADVLLSESESALARVRADEIDFVKQAREHTLGIRAFVSGRDGLRSALTSTSDLDDDALERLARETVALARATAEDPLAGLPDGDFADDRPDLELVDPLDRELRVEAHIETARRAEAAARATDARIANSEGSESASRFSRIVYANTAGFRGEYESAGHSLSVTPIASENGAMQTDYWMTAGRRRGALEDPESVGRRAAERALRRLGARPVPTCEVPAIFEPLAARGLLGNLVACLSGTSVQRGTSFLAERLGETIASELVTLIDDGRLPGGLGSKPFDAEGLPTRRTRVVERGRLASFLLDSYSARKLRAHPTGNAARTPGAPPAAAPTNFWLEPGDGSLDEIVANTQRGFLVTGMFGHGFNPVTGDFSRGASGLWIERGEIAFPVEEVTVAGNLGDMLRHVDWVGSDLLRLGRIASPSLRIARVTVAGS
jgi:PmbA protein